MNETRAVSCRHFLSPLTFSHSLAARLSSLTHAAANNHADRQRNALTPSTPHHASSLSMTLRAKALYDCVGDSQEELSFKQGDTLLDVAPAPDEGWFTGKLNGRHGLFPGNYVRIIQPGENEVGTRVMDMEASQVAQGTEEDSVLAREHGEFVCLSVSSGQSSGL
ncbi:SH3 domain-containing protein [Powellomyces hirtus]|nr:SH3 domain-containing protein [Powellomyces hirtus]